MKSLSALLFGTLLLTGCKPPVSSEKILVTVNGTPILERQVIAEADKRIDADAARSATMGLTYDEAGRNVTRAFMRDDVLHTLIERQLIADQLKADRIEITDAEVDACFLARAKDRGQTPEEAEQEIKAQGKTLADVKERLRWHTVAVMKLYQIHARDRKELTEAQARQLYDESPAEYYQEEERRVSRILINGPPDVPEPERKAARTRAEELLKRIQSGEDFAGLARAHSEDVLTKSKGGDRGWSKRGFVTAPGNDPFGDVAFAMKNIGDLSGVVETPDGFELILLTGIKEARQKSFDEVKNFIIERERHWEIGNFWEEYAMEMRNRASIQWDPAEAARRAKREKDEREYNEQVAKQVAQTNEAGEPVGGEMPVATTEAPRSGSPNSGPN
jgi:peptidyl-prolyl cis-trans isomerase C